jgi:predicted nucleic acid-binding protein
MLNAKIAIRAAANFRQLRGRGVTIRKTAGLIIGTWCIENNCPLLHSDRDFQPMIEHLGLREF